jgi:hypothetical protein
VHRAEQPPTRQALQVLRQQGAEQHGRPRPFNATAWARCSQVSRHTSQPSAETWRITPVSKTSYAGSRRRGGSTIALLPAPLAPVTTNSG